VLLDVAERPTLTVQHCDFEAFLDQAALRTWLPADAVPRWASLQLADGRGSLVARRVPRLAGLVIDANAADGKLMLELSGATIGRRRLPLPGSARRRWVIDPSDWRPGLRITRVQVSETGVMLGGELAQWSEPLRPAQLLEIRDRLVSVLAGRGITVPLLDRPNAV
jgi:hypothetical protein